MAIFRDPVVPCFERYPARREGGSALAGVRVGRMGPSSKPRWQRDRSGCQKMCVAAAHAVLLFGSPATSLKRSVALRSPASRRGCLSRSVGRADGRIACLALYSPLQDVLNLLEAIAAKPGTFRGFAPGSGRKVSSYVGPCPRIDTSVAGAAEHHPGRSRIAGGGVA